jgi:hypothetical protein
MIKKKLLSNSRFDYRLNMTLPDERYRAVMQAKRLLEELCDPKLTPRVAGGIRDRARGVLRHYPTQWDMKAVEQLAPHVFQEQMEPVYRMIKEYNQDKENGQ